MNRPYPVIDCDGHITESEAQVRKYMDEPYRSRGASFLPGGNYWDRNLSGQLGQEAPDPETWLKAMDDGGMEQAVLFGSAMAFNISLIWEPDVAIAVAKAYNQFLYEEFLSASPRLKGVAILPLQDMDEAVKELRRAVMELGMKGAMIPAWGLHPPLGNKQFFPLYEEAQRLNAVIAVHSGTQGIHHFGADNFERFIEVHTYCFPVGLFKQMTSMMFQGIPERFPELRVGWMEAGCGWLPYWMERMDEEYELRGAVEAPLLKRPPSEYIRDLPWYFHTESGERILPYVISVVGEDSIMYASDFPHWDAEYPASIDAMLDRDDLTEQAKRKILGENAKRLYGLE